MVKSGNAAVDVPKICCHCSGQDVRLGRQITKSGVTQYIWYCADCLRTPNRGGLNAFVSHVTIARWQQTKKLPQDLTKLRLLNDYREGHYCVICGRTGVELHHFAPQALAEFFGADWSSWPAEYLCDEHHELWHSIVTFYMPGPAAPHQGMITRYGNHERLRS